MQDISPPQFYRKVQTQQVFFYFHNFQEVVFSVLLTMIQAFAKGQGNLVSLDTLTKAPIIRNSPSQQDQNETDQRPILTKMLEDVASVILTEDEFSNVKKQPSPKVFNGLVIINDRIQYQVVILVLTIIRLMQAQHRGTAHYNDVVNQIIGSLLKIVQDEPENKLYNFNPSVSFYIVRPRLEEHNEIIAKFEKRLLFEVKHLEEEFYTWNDEENQRKIVDQRDRQQIIKTLLQLLADLVSRDQSGLGMSRKIMEGQLIQQFQSLLQYNNEEKGYLVDDILSKFYMLIGSICSDNPAQIPVLIKNSVIPELLQSFENRLPLSQDVFDTTLYGINQFSIHEEGQTLILGSNIFKSMLERVTDPKLSQYLMTDQMIFRLYLGNVFDRNQQFKEIAKEMVLKYIDVVKKFVKEQAIKFIQTYRRTDLSEEEKITESSKGVSPSENQQIVAALVMIHSFSFISNDNLAHNRHSQEIMGGAVYNQVLDLYKSTVMIPSLKDYQTHFEKSLKILIENQNYPLQVQSFADNLKSQTDQFLNLVGMPLYQLDDFDFQQKDENAELKPIVLLIILQNSCLPKLFKIFLQYRRT